MGVLWFFILMTLIELLPLLWIHFILADFVARMVFNSMLWMSGLTFRKRGKHDLYVPPNSPFDDAGGEDAPLLGSRKSKCMWLVNHRSWADFFVDHILTGYQAAYLSRMLVIVGLPFIGMAGALLDWVWFFRIDAFRKKGTKEIDTEKYNSFIDKKFQATPWRGLIVYPEAERNLSADYSPLKTGMIKYAYTRGIPVQIIIATGKERVVRERSLQAEYGVVSTVQYSRVYDPKDFATDKLFIARIQKTWDRIWRNLYNPRESSEDREKKKETEEVEKEAGETPGDSVATSKTAGDVPLDKDEGEDDGDDVVQEHYHPPYIDKPGMWTSWVQARFTAVMLLFYAVLGVVVWCLAYRA